MAHYDMIGIGIPFYDIVVPVPVSELERLDLKPGAAVSLPLATGMALAERYGSAAMCGGPAANTLAGAAALGMSCGHIGVLGGDAAGAATRSNLAQRGIDQLYKTAAGMTTPVIYVLVTPDGERSFIVFINNGEDLRPELLPERLETLSGMFYSQLKFLGRGGLTTLFEAPFRRARQHGAQVAYGLQSFNRHSKAAHAMHALVAETATIVIGNDEEMTEFLAGCDHAGSTHEMPGITPAIMLVRTRGRDGVEIRQRGTTIEARPPEAVTDIVDTIGAGDQFAAGFLCGIRHKLPLERCAAIGFRTAARILRQRGGQPPSGTDWRGLAL